MEPAPRPPCRKCRVIRLFLLSVAFIVSLHFLRPGLFSIVGNLTPLTISLVFVGTLAASAVARHLFARLTGK